MAWLGVLFSNGTLQYRDGIAVIIFGPPGIEMTHDGESSLRDFTAYHSIGEGNFLRIPFIGMPWPRSVARPAPMTGVTAKNFAVWLIESFTYDLTHEIVEVSVDPGLTGPEIGDPCANAPLIRFASWVATKYWSKADDRCVPTSWFDWQPLGGAGIVRGRPAAFFRKPEICDIFARGLDDQLWQRSYVAGQGWFPNWIRVDPTNNADRTFEVDPAEWTTEAGT